MHKVRRALFLLPLLACLSFLTGCLTTMVIIDALQWPSAQSADTIEAYETFIEQHGESEHVAEAHARIEVLKDEKEWADTEKAASIAAYTIFLRYHAGSRHAAEAKTRLADLVLDRDWSGARAADSVLSYGDFTRQHPKSRHEGEAATRAAAAAVRESWGKAQRTDSVASYSDYLRRYPGSPHTAEARSRIDALITTAEWEAAARDDTLEAFETFLRRHPSSELAGRAAARAEVLREHHDEWIAARMADTITAYRDLIGKYPGSPYVARAESIINDRVRKLIPWSSAEKTADALVASGWTSVTDWERVYCWLARKQSGRLIVHWETTKTILLDAARSAREPRERWDAVEALVALGVDETIVDLALILEDGDSSLAAIYLNCGNEILSDMAEQWARKRGYEVQHIPGSGGSTRWGGL
jgi:outer membrane protein assembly factor BamD (BamD/ComL family)